MRETSTSSTFPVLYAQGSHYEVGFQIGAICKESARELVSNLKESVDTSGTDFEGIVNRATKCLPYALEFYHEYVEEIQGYADGAEVKFDEIFASLFAAYEMPGSSRGCTDVVASINVTADESILVAHNEDWYSQDFKHLRFVRAKIADEPEFAAMSYGGILPTVGLNSQGISLTGNALQPNDTRIGIPKTFPARKILAARTISEAIEASIPPNRASSYNNIICNLDGEVYDIEGSATDFEVIYGTEGYLVHTNHYVSNKMKRFEEDAAKTVNSIVRYNVALKLLKRQLGQVTFDSLRRIMSDHVDFPWSICRHTNARNPPWQTLFSVIIDVGHSTMWISHGNPCSEEYVMHQLK